ncbi:MAG TPA: hypothetical protein VFX01_08865 [Methylophilaceae bacterium]|nr:hypothetical protein [Methylophilaceae bacterium]
MRKSQQIQAEINAIRAKDRAYNNLVNEGGEGYERDSVPSALYQELRAADESEFLALWTVELLAVRRAAWNAGVAALTKQHGSNIPTAAVRDLENSLGYKLDDIKRAKRLHGVA